MSEEKSRRGLVPGTVLKCDACGSIHDVGPVTPGTPMFDLLLRMTVEDTQCTAYPCYHKPLRIIRAPASVCRNADGSITWFDSIDLGGA